MAWKLNDDRPVYLQLMEQIKHRIVAEEYQAGEKLPSVRDLAMEASVNPNTMQRALSNLEKEGLIYAERTSGRFVTEDTGMIKESKTALAKEVTAEFIRQMRELGFTAAEMIALITNQEEVHA